MKTLSFISVSLFIFCSCNNSKTNVASTSAPQTTTSVIATPTPTETAIPGDLPPPPCAVSLLEATPKSIEANYTDALYTDPTKAAFAGQGHEFASAFRGMTIAFSHYLKKNQPFEKKYFTFYSRVYFSADGKIDYFFYKLYPLTLNKDEAAIFKKSLSEFIKTYKFPMTAKVAFAQYSPVSIDQF
jgi:hypothetical protein